MIGKTQAARQPSIDDLLTSIRQAIHERVAPGEPSKPAAGSGAASGGDGHRMKRTIVTSGQEGFAGLLGGDVRLEEALARLNQAGWRRGAEAPASAGPGPVAVAIDEAPAATPRLRPTIDDWEGGPATPARSAPTQATPIRPTPPAPIFKAGQDTCKPDATIRKHELREGLAQGEYRSISRPAERIPDVFAGTRTNDLVSSDTANAANSAFTRLAEATASRVPGGKPQLDEVTRECLRPLLKAWLDENLPGLVERLVREEIERVARPGR